MSDKPVWKNYNKSAAERWAKIPGAIKQEAQIPSDEDELDEDESTDTFVAYAIEDEEDEDELEDLEEGDDVIE